MKIKLFQLFSNQIFFLVLFSIACFSSKFSFGQSVIPKDIQVPQEMEFAGMRLIIDDFARAKIKKDADRLLRSEQHFNILKDRVYRFFPVMERILDDEGIPNDFKYLAVQESALLSDAVSTSNAVGYWQFKQATALEMGVLINNEVDERKNIVTSTRGAAKYLKRNNFFTKNWIHTLLSYNLGLSGVRSYIKEDEIGNAKMDIDGNTHWYVLRCLAHKLVFQEILKERPQTTITLLVHSQANGRTLSEISEDMNVPLETIKLYNKWLIASRIPENRTYHVLVPVDFESAPLVSGKIKTVEDEMVKEKLASENDVVKSESVLIKPQTIEKPVVIKPIFKLVNGKKGILAITGDNASKIAKESDIELDKLLSYNDLSSTDKIIPGEIYYLEKKEKKSTVEFYTAQPGETLWQISQRFAIRYDALLHLNRMERLEPLVPGRVLYLSRRRHKKEPVKIEKITLVTATKEPEKKTQENNIEIKKKSQDPIPLNPEKNISKVEEVKASIIDKDTKDTSIAELVKKEPLATYKTHLVKPQETLFGIAKLYSVSISDIKFWNNLSEEEGIKTNQELLVSDPMKKMDLSLAKTESKLPAQLDSLKTENTAVITGEYKTHIVQTGESLFKLAWNYNCTIQDIMVWNNKTESKIRIGEKLKILIKK